MTIAEAKKILSGKLVFGDPQQIKAVRFIENVDAAEGAIKNCPNIEKHLRKGFFNLEYCDCADRISEDVLRSAFERIRLDYSKTTR